MFHVQLYSAGVDSFVGWYYLQKEHNIEPVKVYWDLGHRYSQVEKQYARQHLANIFEEGYIGRYFEKPDAHIPNRNVLLVLLTQAYYDSYAKDMTIWIGGLSDDRVNDNNAEFVNSVNTLLKTLYPDRQIQVRSVFDYKISKLEAVKWYTKYYSSILLKEYTFSCYSPKVPFMNDLDIDPHCYSCKACFRRNVALYHVGIELPFYNEDLVSMYYRNASMNKYPQDRKKAILNYIEYLKGEGLWKNE